MAFGLLMLSACGPSLDGLVRDKHYKEAICAGKDGDDEDPRLVGRALDVDAGLLVHMHVVSVEELRPVLEAATDQVSARARPVEVSAQSNILPSWGPEGHRGGGAGEVREQRNAARPRDDARRLRERASCA